MIDHECTHYVGMLFKQAIRTYVHHACENWIRNSMYMISSPSSLSFPYRMLSLFCRYVIPSIPWRPLAVVFQSFRTLQTGKNFLWYDSGLQFSFTKACDARPPRIPQMLNREMADFICLAVKNGRMSMCCLWALELDSCFGGLGLFLMSTTVRSRSQEIRG